MNQKNIKRLLEEIAVKRKQIKTFRFKGGLATALTFLSTIASHIAYEKY